jgi:hypothetical protein
MSKDHNYLKFKIIDFTGLLYRTCTDSWWMLLLCGCWYVGVMLLCCHAFVNERADVVVVQSRLINEDHVPAMKINNPANAKKCEQKIGVEARKNLLMGRES